MLQRRLRWFLQPGTGAGMRARMAKLCVPLALSAYLRSGLVTLEQFLIPWGLARAGGSEEASMAAYGTIHAMVFPILMFPAAILYTVADLLVPELARCRAEENTARIHHLTGTCLRMGLLFALAAACLMGALSGGLGQLIYKNADCGHYLLVFAPSVVMLYLDAMVDGMLKGFGEQTACVRYNVFTSVLDVALLYLLLPRFGMMAYVLTFYFTHAVNFWLSLHRLLRVTGYRLDGKFLPRAVFCALGAWRELLSAGRGTASGDGSAGRIICVSVFAVSGIHGYRSGTGPAVAAKSLACGGENAVDFCGKESYDKPVKRQKKERSS